MYMVACSFILFILIIMCYSFGMNMAEFIHSVFGGCLGSFWYLTVLINIAMNIVLHIVC